MRINVYAEELTEEVRIISVERKNQIFHGVRFVLKSPPGLQDSKTNDDRSSAVTIWFPSKEEAERVLSLALHAIKQS